MPHNDDRYLLLLAEECNELAKECLKVVRFGEEFNHRPQIVQEFGDVLEVARLYGITPSQVDVKKAVEVKVQRLAIFGPDGEHFKERGNEV